MASTTFVDGTPTDPAWFNDVNSGIYKAASGTASTINRTLISKLTDVVTAKDFGAVGDGVTDDTAAIQAYLNSGHTDIYFPAGTYKSKRLDIPNTVKKFQGSGWSTKFLYADPTFPSSPFLYFGNLNGLEVHSFSIEADKTIYPNVSTLYFGACAYGTVHNIRVINSGTYAIYAPGCTSVSFKDIQVDAFSLCAFRADASPSNITVDNLRALTAGTSHSIQIIGGSLHNITNCFTNRSGATVFGINYLTVTDSIISNNICLTNTLEGINIQDSIGVSIIGNVVTCAGGHQDFGISIYAANSLTSRNIVSGNKVYFAGKSGIALASTPTYLCNYNHISGNLIVSCNQLNEAQGAGVILYGSTLCSNNTIQGNKIVDEGSTTKYGVNEWNDGGGNPNTNYIIDNHTTGNGLTSYSHRLTSTTKIWDVLFSNYAPPVVAATGAITSYGVNVAKYRPRGDVVELDLDITIITAGTGAGALKVDLPPNYAAPALASCISGKEVTVSGNTVSGECNPTLVNFTKYNNTTLIANGARLVATGQYRLS